MIVTVHTDGSAQPGGQNFGGYGVIITARHRGRNIIKKYQSKKYCDTTNNRMELKAVIKAMQLIEPGHKIDVHSDSKYVIDGINWHLPNWINSGNIMKKANPGLWLKVEILLDKHRGNGTTFNFIWIRGHNGNDLNEMADKLAKAARLVKGQGAVCKTEN